MCCSGQVAARTLHSLRARRSVLDAGVASGCYALVLTRQGRIVADVLVIARPGDAFWLELARDTGRTLAQQAAHLGDWISTRRAQPFIVLGDFNRVPPASPDDAFWQRLQTDHTQLLADQLPFRNCFIGQPYWQFIDHVLVVDAQCASTGID